MSLSTLDLRRATLRLFQWVEAQSFAGWDPHDALNSPALKALSLGDRRLGMLWVQLVKRAPFNVRPLFGVRAGHNPKGMGLFLRAYLRRYELGNTAKHLEQARYFADWLRANATGGYSGPCWGYNFDWPNRSFYARAGVPTVVNTAFNGFALLDWMRHEPGVLNVVRGACEFVLRDLQRIGQTADELCFSYTPLDSAVVHNASVLGGRLLAEVYAHTQEPELRAAALASARFTARRQRADGAWAYGEAAKYRWVDNFHTGYVLIALRRIGICAGTDEFEPAVRKGYQYWRQNMIAAPGIPRYFDTSTYPVDAHACAQMLLTCCTFQDLDSESLDLADACARWTIANMQGQDGSVFYQWTPNRVVRTPFMRWIQAWMLHGMTEYLSVRNETLD
jgi:hypothetical protein